MRIRSAFGLILVLAVSFLVTDMARAQDTLQRTITVRGEGTINATPDHAVVYFGVTTTHKDPEKARANNASASAQAMNQVRALGIEERYIRMESLRLQPERRYNESTRTYDQIGFEAVRDIKVTVNDLDELPTLIAKIVQAGANRLNGISYDIKDREGYRREALKLAAENAHEKARLLVETVGATLGPVLQINEDGIQMPRPMMLKEASMMGARMADAAPEPDAYAAGEMEVTANVTLTFSIR